MNLSTGQVEKNVRLGANQHGNGDYDEILTIEKNALADKGVQAEIAKLNLPDNAEIVMDPWIYGGNSSSPSMLTEIADLLLDRVRRCQR